MMALPTRLYGSFAGKVPAQDAFSINGITLTGVQCEWARDDLQTTTSNTRTYSDYASHSWNLRELLVSQWIPLRNLRGQQVTIVTTDIDARNTLRNYSDAILEEVGGNQEGHLQRDVNLTFKVFVE